MNACRREFLSPCPFVAGDDCPIPLSLLIPELDGLTRHVFCMCGKRSRTNPDLRDIILVDSTNTGKAKLPVRIYRWLGL